MSKKFAIGAIIGAVAGVVAGVLTAPKSGKETRTDIKNKATELKDQASQKSEVAKQKAMETAEDVTAKAGEYVRRGEHAVEGAIDGAKKGFHKK